MREKLAFENPMHRHLASPKERVNAVVRLRYAAFDTAYGKLRVVAEPTTASNASPGRLTKRRPLFEFSAQRRRTATR